jgi:hypothetical protein
MAMCMARAGISTNRNGRLTSGQWRAVFHSLLLARAGDLSIYNYLIVSLIIIWIFMNL